MKKQTTAYTEKVGEGGPRLLHQKELGVDRYHLTSDKVDYLVIEVHHN